MNTWIIKIGNRWIKETLLYREHEITKIRALAQQFGNIYRATTLLQELAQDMSQRHLPITLDRVWTETRSSVRPDPEYRPSSRY